MYIIFNPLLWLNVCNDMNMRCSKFTNSKKKKKNYRLSVNILNSLNSKLKASQILKTKGFIRIWNKKEISGSDTWKCRTKQTPTHARARAHTHTHTNIYIYIYIYIHKYVWSEENSLEFRLLSGNPRWIGISNWELNVNGYRIYN